MIVRMCCAVGESTICAEHGAARFRELGFGDEMSSLRQKRLRMSSACSGILIHEVVAKMVSHVLGGFDVESVWATEKNKPCTEEILHFADHCPNHVSAT